MLGATDEISSAVEEKHKLHQPSNKTFNIFHDIVSTSSTNEFEFTNLKQ